MRIFEKIMVAVCIIMCTVSVFNNRIDYGTLFLGWAIFFKIEND